MRACLGGGSSRGVMEGVEPTREAHGFGSWGRSLGQRRPRPGSVSFRSGTVCVDNLCPISASERSEGSERTAGHAVAELMAFTDDDGSQMVVEVADSDIGLHPVGVQVDGATVASKRLAETMGTLQNVVGVLLGQLRQMPLSPGRPDEVTAEFGVKFTSEVGAVIAKAAGEGHVTVKVKWSSSGSS